MQTINKIRILLCSQSYVWTFASPDAYNFLPNLPNFLASKTNQMKLAGTQKPKLSARFNSMVGSDARLRYLASNLSQVARHALEEANSLTIENVEISLNRLPK